VSLLYDIIVILVFFCICDIFPTFNYGNVNAALMYTCTFPRFFRGMTYLSMIKWLAAGRYIRGKN